ncbi:MAG: glycosyltransferase family 2 protein [Gammaproteobacteria bacterium]|nr:glycosyltransferase family 2 protein [Gammaproteobacteria bacterium]
MIFTTKLIFWISIFLVVYPHALYPPLIALLARYRPHRSRLDEYSAEWPSVTLIISAFNEEDVISAKLENAVAIDYPPEHLNILVISDASDDETDQIVLQWSAKEPRISLHRQERRLGKTMGLNAGISQIKSELIVFSDANAMYQPNAMKELVKYFRDQRVGYVVGAALYNQDESSKANQSEDLYWNMELSLKQWESDFYSVVGGDGAIYAIRRNLFWELAEDDINDFINPLQIIAQGYLGVFNPRAVCYEDTAEEFAKEFGRKRRIVNRSWRAFLKSLPRFSLTQHGRFLFELFSHKVIRWLSGLFLLLSILASAILAGVDHDPLYILAFACLLSSFLVALIGYWLDRNSAVMPKVIYLPYYFYFVSHAAILGIIDNIKGVRHITWNHVRGEKQ